tara:strand:+ start:1638 stop:1901 length:264 start_codon:yes stop_codon:yes gene_type:complete
MTQSDSQNADQGADARQKVIQEMDAAMKRLSNDLPNVDAALMLRLVIGYFAEIYARHFGHAAAIEALTGIARRGVRLAAEELSTPRH